MAVAHYHFNENQNANRKKKPVDALLFEFIGVVVLIYAIFFVSFTINLRKALRYFDAGQYEQAIDKLTEIAPMTAADPAIYYRLALSHSRLGQHDLAVPYYLQLLTIKKPTTPFVFSSRLPGPSYTEIYDGLIYSSFELGQFDNAVIYSQQLLTIDPNDAQAYKMLGITFYKKSLYTKDPEDSRNALRFINKAMELAPAIINAEDNKILKLLKDKLGLKVS